MSDISDTIQIDDVSYEIESLSPVAKHIISQIKECTQKTRELQLKSEVSEVARVGFVELLKKELGHVSPSPEEEKTSDE